MKALKILYTLISSGNDDVFANKNTYEKLTSVVEAIEELEELENRSCDNCRYNKEQGNYMIFCEAMRYGFSKDFCCNKWEAKDEVL